MYAAGAGVPSRTTMHNLGHVTHKGIELSVEARLNRYLAANANYSWQARPDTAQDNVWALNRPPAHRFNAGLSVDCQRYLGSVSVGYVDSAYWNDVLDVMYSGPTAAYTVVNATGGVQFAGGKYLAMLKVTNLANRPIQNHVWGDILKRQVSGELRVRF